jgi:hypothetical protein
MHNFQISHNKTNPGLIDSCLRLHAFGSQKSRGKALRLLGKSRSHLVALRISSARFTSRFVPATTTTDPRPDSGQHRKDGYRYRMLRTSKSRVKHCANNFADRPQAQDVSANRIPSDQKEQTLIQHTATVTARPRSQTMTTSSSCSAVLFIPGSFGTVMLTFRVKAQALQLLGPQDRLCFQPGRPPSPENVKDAQQVSLTL